MQYDDKNLHYLKDPELWELWCIPSYGVVQDVYHQAYEGLSPPALSPKLR